MHRSGWCWRLSMRISMQRSLWKQAPLGGDIHHVRQPPCGFRGGATTGPSEAVITAAPRIIPGIRLAGFDPAGADHPFNGAIECARPQLDSPAAAGFDLLHDGIAMEWLAGQREEDFEFDGGGSCFSFQSPEGGFY